MKSHILASVLWKGKSYPIIQATENYYLVESIEGKKFSIHVGEGKVLLPKTTKQPKIGRPKKI